MWRSSRVSSLLAGASFMVLSLAGLPSGEANPEGSASAPLFRATTRSAELAPENEPTTIRSRFVEVDTSVLGTLTAPAASVSLNLFDDTSFTATLERTESNVLGSFAWVGRLDGIPHGHVVVTATKGLVAGMISLPLETYMVEPAGNQVTAIRQIDQSAFPPELEPVEAPSASAPERADKQVRVDACDQITVLVAYSPEARAAAGGVAEMESLIALAVAETNMSYAASALTQRIVLVHTMETSPGHASNDFAVDLNALANLTDGVFTNVDAAREAFAADEVALIIENSSSCGIGYLDATAASAFSVAHRTCATGYYSFGHELGHNMGARHDWYMDDSLLNAAHGFVNVAEQWRTIMAYNNLCVDNATDCTRIPYWSNPDLTYLGNPTGVSSAGPTNCVAGSMSPDPTTCAADNRSILNSTCSTVANFRFDGVNDGVWNAASDFNTSSNPTGTWSYGSETTGAPDWTSFTPYSNLVYDGPSPVWNAPLAAASMWLNLSSDGYYGVPLNWLSIHPGSSEQPSVIRWTSPISGQVELSGSFLAGDTGTMDVYIQVNGVTVWSALDFSTDQPFALTQAVAAGDAIDWLVTGGYFYGNTPVAINITDVTSVFNDGFESGGTTAWDGVVP